MTNEIKFLGITMNWTSAAIENAEECGLRHGEVADDIEAVRTGALSEEQLLECCLDGADEDRVQGWTDYVEAVAVAVAEEDERQDRMIAVRSGEIRNAR